MTDPYLEFLVGHAGPDGWAEISTRALAAELGVTQSNVSRAMRRLLKTGALLVENRAGRVPRYRLTHLDSPLDSPLTHPDSPERRGAPPDPHDSPPKGGESLGGSRNRPRKTDSPPAPNFASGSGIIHNWADEPADDHQVSSPETGTRWFAHYREQLRRPPGGGQQRSPVA